MVFNRLDWHQGFYTRDAVSENALCVLNLSMVTDLALWSRFIFAFVFMTTLYRYFYGRRPVTERSLVPGM